MAVVSVVVNVTEQLNERVEVRYMMTDHLGNNYSTLPRVLPASFDKAFDEAAAIVALERQLAELEVNNVLSELRESRNPFRDVDGNQVPSSHQTYPQLLTKVFSRLLSMDSVEIINYSGALQFVVSLDDAMLSAVAPTATPTKIRAWALSLQAAASAIAEYEVSRNG